MNQTSERLPLFPRWIDRHTMSQRRELHFQSLDAAMCDAQAISASGYRMVGAWSLGRICDHLGKVLRYSRVGFPQVKPWPLRVIARAMAKRGILNRSLKKMRCPTPIVTSYSGTDETGLASFASGITRFMQNGTDYFKHPWLGQLSADEWRRFHLWHCDHHLSYLLPK